MRILFITANRIGDAVLTTGLLAHLVDTYPDARFTIACGPVAADLFRAVPKLDRLFLLQKRKFNGHWIDLWKTCVGTRWDLIVDLRNSVVTRLLFARQKVYRLAHNSGRHKVEDHASILNLTPPPSPHIWVDDQAEKKSASLLENAGKILALGPSANWPPKQWPAERFAILAQKLTKDGAPLAGAKVLLVAAPHERDQLAPIFRTLPKEQVIDAIGLDLLAVAACVRRAALFIGNDSGLTHIAASMDTKTLALFGPGWEKIYGPWGPHTCVVRPTESSQTLLDSLPYAGAFAPNLMGGISVEAAFDAACHLLEKSSLSTRETTN